MHKATQNTMLRQGWSSRLGPGGCGLAELLPTETTPPSNLMCNSWHLLPLPQRKSKKSQEALHAWLMQVEAQHSAQALVGVAFGGAARPGRTHLLTASKSSALSDFASST